MIIVLVVGGGENGREIRRASLSLYIPTTKGKREREKWTHQVGFSLVKNSRKSLDIDVRAKVNAKWWGKDS